MKQTIDAASLRTRLRHVYWIGGGTGAGKSTIARRLSARYGLHLYDTAQAMSDHASRSTRAGARPRTPRTCTGSSPWTWTSGG